MKYILSVFLILKVYSSSLNLHPNHVPFASYYSSKRNNSLQSRACWGYEKGCDLQLSYFKPPMDCASENLKDDFIKRADFGYVKERQHENMLLCEGKKLTHSRLSCSRYTRYCTGRNIFINLRALQNQGHDKYREDLFSSGDIGGYCKLNKSLLKDQSNHKSPLQSWYAELQNFTELSFPPLEDTRHCDVIMNHTVVFMKLDYGGNMFHHFCDFFNLYMSQHVNQSWFDLDIRIIMWDTASSHYFDPFSASWKVFTKHPVQALMDFKGKRLCVKDVMFPLLPRMISGLYYNTYVPDTCVGSNLFRAFSEHFLYRMGVAQKGPLVREGRAELRITLLQRGNPTKANVYRQIRNQQDLVREISQLPDVDVKVVEYDWKAMPFEEQLSITHNTDIFIGMHGAGLAHFMFLPDWAVAFELYNCGDRHCYYDLARLRGLHYITWPSDAPEPTPHDQGKHHRYGDNPKFWNWEFDPPTFVRAVRRAVDAVRSNAKYREAVDAILQKEMKSEL